MTEATEPRSRTDLVVRLALGLTGLSLVAYVPYRYVTRPPAFDGLTGSAYALLFPLSLLLAGAAIYLSLRPSALAGFTPEGSGPRRIRSVVGVYGGLWVLMGLTCLPSLGALAEAAPLRGLLATIHMTAQHVFLGFAAVAVALRPVEADAILRGERVGGEVEHAELVAEGRGSV